MRLNKILFYIPSRLGDAVMLTPSVTLIKQLQPNIQIDLIAESELGLSVYKYNPHIHQRFLRQEIEHFAEFTKQYDMFVLAHHAHHSQRTINVLYKCACQCVLVHYQPDEHQSINAMQLVESIFSDSKSATFVFNPTRQRYQIPVAPEDEDFPYSLDIKPSSKLIIFHVGCHGVKRKLSDYFKLTQVKHEKTWAIENYVALATRFKQLSDDFKFVLTGTHHESRLIQTFLRKHPDSIPLIDKTSVHQLFALITHANLFISGDTGAMHIASATETPQIALFGSTSPVRTGPFPPREHKITLSHQNMDALKVDTVFSTACHVMGLTPSSKA